MKVDSGEWVVYQAPKSVSFGHQSRIRDPRRAWPAVEKFLNDLTLFTLDDRIELACHDAGPQTDAEVAATRHREAQRCFGPEVPQGSYRTHPRWKLDAIQLPAAIQFALDDDRFPKQESGPTWLSFHYQFHWKEFGAPSIEPGGADRRIGVSRLGIHLGGQRLFLQPHFVYPAPWNSEVLKDFIDRSELVVPFRFRDQYFQRWLPPKSPASGGRSLRLERTWRRGSVLH
jgi:hypothetical protein